MSRFRYIQQDGTEGRADTVTELVSAYEASLLGPHAMLFDAAMGRWAPAAEHDVIATLRSTGWRDDVAADCATAEGGGTVPADAEHDVPTGGPSGPGVADAARTAAMPPSRPEATYPSGRSVFARIVDVTVTPLVAVFIVALFVSLLGANGDGSTVFFGLLSAAVMIPTEALCLVTLGATPGKLLTGLRVVDASSGRRPPFSQALYRSWLVWFRGFGLGIPIVFLICWVVAYGKFRSLGRPTWDTDTGTMVVLRTGRA